MKPRAKYGNKKTVVDGLTFDSKAEARRYAELKLLERRGDISDLRMQVQIQIAPGVLIKGAARRSPPLRYVADFGYRTAAGEDVIEDVKGALTDVYKIKRHLLALQGVVIQEVRAA